MIRVTIPVHLQRLINTGREVGLEVAGPVTQNAILEALENRYPALRGTIRDATTHQRRAFIRYFTCGEDVSLADPDAALPQAVVRGTEKFMIVGAMAGG